MMKKLLLVLMIVTLMAGMSLPALAQENDLDPQTPKFYYPYCDEAPVDMTFPVKVEIKPWASIEFAGEFDFEEVGFCDLEGYKLYWINGGAFKSREGGAENAKLPDGTGSWNDVTNHVHVNEERGESNEVNPRVKVKTNTEINLTFKFVEQDQENWPANLPFYIPVYQKKTGGHQTGYVARFGRNVDVFDGKPIYDFATITIPASDWVEYHLAGGILFSEENFWKQPAGGYYTTIVATVDVP